MATVDAGDDTLTRYVVYRYCYDPDRHERRHRVVTAFDNEREFRQTLDRLSAELQNEKACGEADAREHYSGTVLEPGHQRRQQDARTLRRAIQHGAVISDEFLAPLELPRGVAVVRARRDDE